MKCVAEDDVTENIVRFVVRDVKRGVHLEIRRDVPRESDRGRVARARLEIDLGAPGFVEVVGVTENGLVPIASVNGASEEFLVRVTITRFDVGLRVDVTVGRPVDEADRQQIRFLP